MPLEDKVTDVSYRYTMARSPTKNGMLSHMDVICGYFARACATKAFSAFFAASACGIMTRNVPGFVEFVEPIIIQKQLNNNNNNTEDGVVPEDSDACAMRTHDSMDDPRALTHTGIRASLRCQSRPDRLILLRWR